MNSPHDKGLYRFFGNLYLRDPEAALDASSLKRLGHLEPFLRDLEARQQSRRGTIEWHYNKPFAHAVKAEIEGWRKRGVQRRPEFAISPGGEHAGRSVRKSVYASQAYDQGIFDFDRMSENSVLQSMSVDDGDDLTCVDESSKESAELGIRSSISIHPDIGNDAPGPQGLKYLISSLVKDDFDVHNATQLCNALFSGEFDRLELTSWQDIPQQLRIWLENEDGLKVRGWPATSGQDLIRVYQLLCRKATSIKCHEESGITGVFLRVAIRYFKQVQRIDPKSRIPNWTVPGKQSIARKCGSCGSDLLDDAFPRFKKLDPTRYVARYLKGGCGAKSCQPSGSSVWAVPYDSQIPWSPPDENLLRRPPQKAKWSDILLCDSDRITGLPRNVICICRRCSDEESITIDHNPRWTIETWARYVPRKPRCRICKSKFVTWEPVDGTISWLDTAALSTLWAQVIREGWPIEAVTQRPDDYFPRRSLKIVSRT
ncbi:hypothetical protein PT974_04320 [Cladobotryum mycophilum]|uniref:Uncharacterized protein n=1 Tax=Cladobotryum mycophilum TaxID=491253 RepID=A0ABR0SUV2_9HYPO